jgi:LAS superfamily LD-carboxypeptidase LdcB
MSTLLIHAMLFGVSPTFLGVGQPREQRAYVQDLDEAGIQNGGLPVDLLTSVTTSQKECLLETTAAASWELLIIQAEHDGITIEAGWCYRSLEAQRRTYIRNCGSIDAPKAACDPKTSSPGNSNHGWGRAVDVTTNGRLLSCRSEAFEWLAAHAGQYGWVHPAWAGCGESGEEPWHWEWGGTETVVGPTSLHGSLPI